MVSYILPIQNGTYEIYAKNYGGRSVDFTISVNTRDMTLVPFNTKITHILIQQSFNYYEFMIP